MITDIYEKQQVVESASMITTRDRLTVPVILERAEQAFPERIIASRTRSGVFRYTYHEFARRVRKLAAALVTSGVREGDHVATLAWNQHRHLEACFAVPTIGAVLHPLDLRLSPAQLTSIINHAADKVILADADLVLQLESAAPRLETVNRYIVMSDESETQTRLTHVTSYEAFIEPAEPIRQWPELNGHDEAGIYLASATSEFPEEVTYTHHALRQSSLGFRLADAVGVSAQDTTLMVAPLCHANALGILIAAISMGAALVLPGPHPDVNVFCELMDQERVTLAVGVPAVWLDVLALLGREPYSASDVSRVLCRALPLQDLHRTVRMTFDGTIAWGGTGNAERI